MSNFIDWLGHIIFVISTVYTTFKFFFWLIIICAAVYWSIRNWKVIIAVKNKIVGIFQSSGNIVSDAQRTADDIFSMIQGISTDTPELIKKIGALTDTLNNIKEQLAELHVMRTRLELMDVKLDEIKRKQLDI